MTIDGFSHWLATATDAFADEELERLLDYCVAYPGILEVCQQGSGVFSWLVVNGPAYGTIWDGREDFYPTGLTFGIWYRVGWSELCECGTTSG
jgi:hypothetical protein